MRAKAFLFLCLSLYFSSLFAQDPQVDSLKKELKKKNHDTIHCALLSALSEFAPEGEWQAYTDSLMHFCERRLKTLPASGQGYREIRKFYGDALTNKGYLENQEGNISGAMDYYKRSIAIKEELNDEQGLAIVFNNIGYIHKNQGNIPLAIDYYNRSLKLQEKIRLPNGEIKDKKGLAFSFANLAVIYKDNGDPGKAMEYNLKSLKIRQKIKDKPGIAQSLNNIGFIHIEGNEIDKALEYFQKSLILREEVGEKTSIANSLHNLAHAHQKKGNLAKALELYLKCIGLQEEASDKHGLGYSLNSIATVYLEQNKIPEALKYSLRGMEQAKLVGSPGNIKNAARVLYRIYKTKGDTKTALENYKLYIRMNDSLVNETNRKASITSQLKYQYEKKAAADSVRVMEEKKVIAARLKQEETQRFVLYGGLILVGLFSLFMINRFRITRKQKFIIEQQKKVVEAQKHIVDEKQRELLDSIRYAKRIQTSLLPQEKYIEKVFSKK